MNWLKSVLTRRGKVSVDQDGRLVDTKSVLLIRLQVKYSPSYIIHIIRYVVYTRTRELASLNMYVGFYVVCQLYTIQILTTFRQ